MKNVFLLHKRLWCIALLLAFSSCVSQKNLVLQADDIFQGITKNMNAIQEAEKLKFSKIAQFIKLAQIKTLNNEDAKYAETLFESMKKRQLNLKKMRSQDIDKYDDMTKKLLVKLTEMERANKNDALSKKLQEIKKIDNQDVIRRANYDKSVLTWNELLHKSDKKLRKIKKYQKAQLLPLFTINLKTDH